MERLRSHGPANNAVHVPMAMAHRTSCFIDIKERTGWSMNASGSRLCGAGRNALRGQARSARRTRSLPPVIWAACQEITTLCPRRFTGDPVCSRASTINPPPQAPAKFPDVMFLTVRLSTWLAPQTCASMLQSLQTLPYPNPLTPQTPRPGQAAVRGACTVAAHTLHHYPTPQ